MVIHAAARTPPTRGTPLTTTSTLRREMQGVLDAWAAAMVADDADRIAAFADPDWVLVTPNRGP